MKVILTLLCAIMVLFGGGCALALVPGLSVSNVVTGGWLFLLPLAILFFNAAVIAALWGWKAPWKPAFYTLAVVDGLVAALLLTLTLAWANSDPFVMPWGLAATAAFGVKSALTWFYARRFAKSPQP